MIEVDVETDLDDLIQRLPKEKTAMAIMSRAINRGITAGRTQATREVAREYTVKVSRARHSSKVTKASASNPAAEVSFSGGALNISHFQVRPTKPQPARRPVLRATIRRSKGPVDIKGAFLAPLRGGVKAGRRKGRSRLPIEQVFGPSVPSMMGADGIRESVMERMKDVITRRLDHEVNRELGRLTK